ncbi:MAG: rod shape-determining protein MreC [Bacteroidales bacterium]
MRNLLRFLLKNYFIFLFLGLEFIAIFLIINHNRYQKTVFAQTATEINGIFGSRIMNFNEYLSLKKTNSLLVEENKYLRDQLYNLPLYSDSSKQSVIDTSFSFIPAKVISLNTFQQNNYMIINKGIAEGIKKDMGVISSNGVVGIITNVSNNYSAIMLLIHQQSIISARVKKNNQLVNVSWPGENYRYGLVEDIPYHIHLQKGDTIITSGNSFLFPRNINIGTITSQHVEEGVKLNTADMKFFNDFKSLQYVYVVNNQQKEQEIQLLDSLGLNN